MEFVLCTLLQYLEIFPTEQLIRPHLEKQEASQKIVSSLFAAIGQKQTGVLN